MEAMIGASCSSAGGDDTGQRAGQAAGEATGDDGGNGSDDDAAAGGGNSDDDGEEGPTWVPPVLATRASRNVGVNEVVEKTEESQKDFCSRTRLHSEESADFQGHHRNRGFRCFQSGWKCGQSFVSCHVCRWHLYLGIHKELMLCFVSAIPIVR